MVECERCLTEKKERTIQGKKVEMCLDFDCLADRMLEQYEGCAHDLETVGENLLKCKHCGMGATPSYEKYP